MASGIADQAGIPETRSENATSRFIARRRPLRWPTTIPSIAAVAIIAPAVAAITWPIAAPPAGALFAAARAAGAAPSSVAMTRANTADALFAGVLIRAALLRSLTYITNQPFS